MSQKSYSRPVQSSEFHVFKIVCSNVFVYNVPTFMKFDKTLDSNPIIYIYMWKGPLCIEWRCLKYRSIIHNYIDTFLHRKNIYKKRIVLVMFLLFVQLSTDVLEIKGAAGFLTKWRWPGKKCHRCEFARINQKKFCTHHHLDAWMRSLRNMLSHMGKSWVLVFLCWKQHQNMYCGPAGYNAFLSA